MLRGMLAGLFGGIIMGITMKWLELLSGKKVYVLLLNVDFLPWFGKQNFSELMEFLFHLIIAIIIGTVFAIVVKTQHLNTFKKQLFLSTVLTFPTILLYFPLTLLAKKATPPPTDLVAILLWIVGHLIFAISLPYFFKFQPTQKG